MTLFHENAEMREAHREEMLDDMDFSDLKPIVHLEPDPDMIIMGHSLEYFKKIISKQWHLTD